MSNFNNKRQRNQHSLQHRLNGGQGPHKTESETAAPRPDFIAPAPRAAQAADPLSKSAREKSSWDSATKLLDYVYHLKIEADTRAQSILNTNTLMVGILAIAATLLAKTTNRFNPSVASFWVFIGCSVLGVLVILASQLVALSVYTPIVEDPGSLFEPEFLKTQSVDALKQLIKDSDSDQMLTAISQECIAVARVQVKRAKKVKLARKIVIAGLSFLTLSLVALGLHLWGY